MLNFLNIILFRKVSEPCLNLKRQSPLLYTIVNLVYTITYPLYTIVSLAYTITRLVYIVTFNLVSTVIILPSNPVYKVRIRVYKMRILVYKVHIQVFKVPIYTVAVANLVYKSHVLCYRAPFLVYDLYTRQIFTGSQAVQVSLMYGLANHSPVYVLPIPATYKRLHQALINPIKLPNNIWLYKIQRQLYSLACHLVITVQVYTNQPL